MKVSEKWGTDIDTAVELALQELGVGRDEVEIEVLEQPSRGFFGIGSKLALVRVTVMENEPEATNDKEKREFDVKNQETTIEEAKVGKEPVSEIMSEQKQKATSQKKRKKKNQKNEKRDDENKNASESVLPEFDMSSLKDLDDENVALVFLKGLISEMGIELNVVGKTDDTDLFFFLEGKDSGTVIGKRGATLDAIQYLTSLVVNKDNGEYVRVVVDAENYRAKREKSLEKLARRLADKVARTRRPFKLEPMNPYERKIIHATLQKDPRVTTKSEGQDPYRRVHIELK
ncbi:MAG: RNA-binding cell elongation regulator Jag/EloR [Eubacterium sp.]|nr:RNA-binding cell elongation regulator Jag/EloR [Eubacterium sp.]